MFVFGLLCRLSKSKYLLYKSNDIKRNYMGIFRLSHRSRQKTNTSWKVDRYILTDPLYSFELSAATLHYFYLLILQYVSTLNIADTSCTIRWQISCFHNDISTDIVVKVTLSTKYRLREDEAYRNIWNKLFISSLVQTQRINW